MSQRPKTCVITGATAGIGKAIAERLAKDGWSLVITGRRIELLSEVATNLSTLYGAEVLPMAVDVRSRQQVEEGISRLPAQFQALQLLVNNAGLALGLEAVPDCRFEDWETMIDTNCKGLIYFTKLLSPHLKKFGKGSTIINIGSTAGSYSYFGGNVYCATKAFVDRFSECLRCDLAGSGIRVSNVQPGIVHTDFSKIRLRGDLKSADAVYADRAPLKADDIAETVHWLATRPDHVDVTRLEIFPTSQTPAGFRFVTD